MADIRIATDYLQDLFAKLAAGRQDPSRVDWPFAEKAWRVVCGEIERLRGEIEQLRRERDAAQAAIRAWELASELEMKAMTIRYNESIAHLSCPECSGYWSVGDLPAGKHHDLTCPHCAAGPMTDRLSRELTEAMRLLREAQVSLGGNPKLKARVDAFIETHDEAVLVAESGEGG